MQIILISVCAGIFLVAVFFYVRSAIHSRTTWEKAIIRGAERLGIINIRQSGIEIQGCKEKIRNAKTIKIFAVTGVNVIRLYRIELLHALNNGGSVEVLLPSADSSAIKEAQPIIFPHQNRQLESDVVTSKELLREYADEMRRKARNRENSYSPGRVLLGEYDTLNKIPLIICDDNYVFFKITLPPHRSSESPSFELRKRDEGLLNFFVTHFNKTWEYLEKTHRVTEL